MSRRARSARGAALVALIFGSSGVRASVFSASVGGQSISNSSTPIYVSNFNLGLGKVDAEAIASASVGAAASAITGSAGPFTTSFGQQSASAHSTIDDIIFSGPGSSVDATILLPFDIAFERYFEDWSGNTNFAGFSSTDQTFQLSFGGSNIQTFDTLNGVLSSPDELIHINSTIPNDPQIHYTFRQTFQFVKGLTTTNTSNGLPAAGRAITEEFELTGLVAIHQQFPVGTPLFLDLHLFVDSTTHDLFVSSGSAVTFGLHSFGIPTGVSGFDLPAGYTVNAASIGLVNGIIPDASAPEPASLALFGAGCLALLWVRRVRRQAR